MQKVITTIYENGALHPIFPLQLQEQAEVQVEILAIDRKKKTLTHQHTSANREIAAYKTMFPMLKKRYLAHYVAVFGENLIDFDIDKMKLCQRIKRKYADQFVLISQVDMEPDSICMESYETCIASSESMAPRVPGSAKSKIWIAPDFNDPLPDDILDSFEGKIIA